MEGGAARPAATPYQVGKGATLRFLNLTSVLVRNRLIAYLSPIMRIPSLAVLTAVSAVLVSCSSVEMPKGTSKGYSSVRFVKEGSEPLPQFAQIDSDVNGMIQNAIRTRFQDSGLVFHSVDTETDLVVTYLLIMQNNIGTTAIEDYFGYGREVESIISAAHEKWVVKGNQEDRFEAGTLVVDVLETSTGKLVYRGYAHGDIKRDVTDEERAERIGGAVEEALQPFFR
ncbi:MAG: hypothetical protein DRP71_02830 [Verrucomicrobia bacterium]|nr:MAG: hypothetical protein DRP71_02830 [Verrucomicrobiota bacterium]